MKNFHDAEALRFIIEHSSVMQALLAISKVHSRNYKKDNLKEAKMDSKILKVVLNSM